MFYISVVVGMFLRTGDKKVILYMPNTYECFGAFFIHGHLM